MKAELRLAVVILVPSIVGLIACSAPPEPKNNISSKCDKTDENADCDDEVKSTKKTPPRTDGEKPPAPTAAPTAPEPVAPATDAITKDGIKNSDETDIDCGGVKAPGCADGKACSVAKDCKNNVCTKNKCEPPQVQTNYCQQLGPCCGTLASTAEKLACMGVQFLGKEIACQAELVLCTTGGVGGTPCGNLNKCCDQMQTEGYDLDAADCRGHNTGNASVCGSWLSQYQNMQWCD
jgi:hypothetical protein